MWGMRVGAGVLGRGVSDGGCLWVYVVMCMVWGMAWLTRGGLREVVIGVYAPVCFVVVVLELVYELVDPVGPMFEPLVLMCFVSLMCEPFALAFTSICLPSLFGPVVLMIGVIAVLGWVYVVVLALVFMGIGIRWGLGLRQTWCDRGCG